MKIIRIFLLILVVLGIGLLVTQKMWAPKLVEVKLKHENREQYVPPISNKSSTPNFKIDGICLQKDISNQSSENIEAYNDFEVVGGYANIQSQIRPCDDNSIDSLTSFALQGAEKRTVVSSSELMWWDITKVNSLKPLQCGIIENPGSENKVVVIKFKMDAEAKKSITGNSLLSFIQLNKNDNPVRILSQFISNKSIYDITRNVEVEHICDLDRDGKVEVVLKDDRYAGYNFWIVKFAEDFSNINLNFIDGMRGD